MEIRLTPFSFSPLALIFLFPPHPFHPCKNMEKDDPEIIENTPDMWLLVRQENLYDNKFYH